MKKNLKNLKMQKKMLIIRHWVMCLLKSSDKENLKKK